MHRGVDGVITYYAYGNNNGQPKLPVDQRDVVTDGHVNGEAVTFLCGRCGKLERRVAEETMHKLLDAAVLQHRDRVVLA